MQYPSISLTDRLTGYYAAGIAAFCEIAHTYFYLGRLDDALHILQALRQSTEAGEVASGDRCKLLLLHGEILNVEHLLRKGTTDLLFATILEARQLAETTHNQQNLADALSLLALAHCYTTTVATLESGSLPFGTREQGKYAEAFAYQQEALKLQEELHDTRGISESYFALGMIYQFWQQNELAREHFLRAIQVAEQHGHILEQAEPNRHLTVDALFQGDLDLALTYAQRALSFREAGGFRLYQPLDHISLWDIYQKKGDTDKAQVHMQQASTLAEEMGLATLIASITSTTSHLGDQTGEA